MTTKHLTSGLVMLFASEGCVLRKKGSDPHSDLRQATVRATDLSDWEEVPVEDVPAYTKAEYDAKVSEMVRGRYSADEEFALQRKMIDALLNPATPMPNSARPAPKIRRFIRSPTTSPSRCRKTLHLLKLSEPRPLCLTH